MPNAGRDVIAALARSRAAIVATWLLTRGVIVALVFLIADGDIGRLQDVNYYIESARHVLDTGSMPNTVLWQYPPGALLAILPPAAAGWGMGYAAVFVALMVACDAVICVLLAAAARAGGSLLGLWAWLLVFPFLREFSVLRFDLLPAMLAAGGLVLLARRPMWMGALLGLGALVKAWPAVLLAAEFRGRPLVRAAGAALVVFVVGVALAAALLGDQSGVVDNQQGRGLQEESIAATWWQARAVVQGEDPPRVYAYGSVQINDPRAADVDHALRWVTLAAMLLLGVWWLRRVLQQRRAGLEGGASVSVGLDFVFVGVLAALVTSRVLSPQFMVWALVVGAVAVSRVETRMRRPFLLVCAATIPVAGILDHPLLLVVRNVLLVAATLDALQLLVRTPAPRPLPLDAETAPDGRASQAAATSAVPTSR